MWFSCGYIHPSRSKSLKVPSAAGCAAVAFVGAAGLTGLKGFQGLDGQWKGLSFDASGVDGLEVLVSSSEDSSLAESLGGAGGAAGGDGTDSGTPYRKFLSGDQPGGRRLVNT